MGLTSAKSIFHAKKNSSFHTIAASANTIIGSVCLVLPFLYKDSGIISSILVSGAIGLVSWKTCSLIELHANSDENEVSLIILRILGKKWKLIYIIAVNILFLNL